MNKINAIILCAGKGTRLKESGKHLPKPLIKFAALNTSSILEHSINNLIELGIQQIAVVVGYLSEKTMDLVSKLQEKDLNLKR